jgi:uncharacterized repeat protein (TIGR03803 family)
MRTKTIFQVAVALAALSGLLTIATGTVAQQFTVLHNFDIVAKDGYSSVTSLVPDDLGNLYGTTWFGGTKRGGIAFELIRGNGWTENVLRNFVYNTSDANEPMGGLIFDNAGNLYGTTAAGGATGLGTVFELTQGGGGWKETILHSFGAGSDGYSPSGNLIFDAAGNLYGTTQFGGPGGGGTVFEMTPKAGGGWSEKVLHGFPLVGRDGNLPQAGLTLDAAGNLYGTTGQGGGLCPTNGASGCGTVFELSPGAGGEWTEKVIHEFGIGGDGLFPSGGVILDDSGNVYGTAPMGGKGCAGSGCGILYELRPNANGTWTEVVLHYFGFGTDGAGPQAALIFDAAGNLYGSTAGGGDYQRGSVFELMPTGKWGWTEKVLHSFNYKDGAAPQASLILSNGNLYGTTSQGGDATGGTVFEVTP